MTYDELRSGLTHVALHGTTQGLPLPLAEALRAHELISGSDGDDGGLIVTPTGRRWLTPPDGCDILSAYNQLLERVFPS